MENEQIIERIKFLISELGMRQVAFGQKVGIDASNLSKYLKGRLPINDSVVNKLVVNLGVSKQWLLNGTDIPFPKQQVAVSEIEVPEASVHETIGGTPIFDIDVTAGTQPRSLMFTADQIIGSINLPEVVSPNCKVVRVSGDSMAPLIHNGDFIAVRELSNFSQIFWGQIYVILLDDFRLVKYIRKHDDPRKVILRSENPNYDDMEIARNDIRDLMLVQNILHFNTRL